MVHLQKIILGIKNWLLDKIAIVMIVLFFLYIIGYRQANTWITYQVASYIRRRPYLQSTIYQFKCLLYTVWLVDFIIAAHVWNQSWDFHYYPYTCIFLLYFINMPLLLVFYSFIQRKFLETKRADALAGEESTDVFWFVLKWTFIPVFSFLMLIYFVIALFADGGLFLNAFYYAFAHCSCAIDLGTYPSTAIFYGNLQNGVWLSQALPDTLATTMTQLVHGDVKDCVQQQQIVTELTVIISSNLINLASISNYFRFIFTIICPIVLPGFSFIAFTVPESLSILVPPGVTYRYYLVYCIEQTATVLFSDPSEFSVYTGATAIEFLLSLVGEFCVY